MTIVLKDKVVNRHENLHYVEWEGVSKPVLAGTGITDWTQASEPSTDDGQYINEKTAHKNMMAYNPSVSYVGELIPNNEFVRHVYEVGKKEIIGAQFTEYEVETWAPVEGSSGNFSAHSRIYEIQPSNPGSGEGGKSPWKELLLKKVKQNTGNTILHQESLLKVTMIIQRVNLLQLYPKHHLYQLVNKNYERVC